MNPRIPERCGRFELLRRLGTGGMGEVHLARDTLSGQRLALKRLLTATTAERARLEEEFGAIARLRHPTIVSVYEFGVGADGRPFYTMEYVPGQQADMALATRDWPALVEVAAEVAHGLEVLHAAGIVHGDVKPSNVLVVGEGTPENPIRGVRLVDFGLSARLGNETTGHRGTAGFAAPEVVAGRPLSTASDLYGLGATLYALAGLRPPFAGPDTESRLRRQLSGPADRGPLEDAGAPAPLIDIVLRLLDADAAGRPATAHDCRRELESLAPSRRRRFADRLRTAIVVGRDDELARIESILSRSESPSHEVVVVGPRGIGRSALLTEIAARAALAGHPICRLTPDRFHSMPAATGVAREPGVATVAHAPGNAAVAEFLRGQIAALASDTSVAAPVCVVDDAQRLDAQSLREIRRLLLDPKVPRSVWIMARSSDEPPSPEERLLEAGGYATLITLQPLSRPAMSEMVVSRLREHVPPELDEFLWRGAGGHPGLTVEILNAAAAAGGVEESDAGLLVRHSVLDHLHAAEDGPLQAVVRALPVPALRVARLLAVAGGASPDELSLMDPGFGAESSGPLIEQGLVVHENGMLRVASEWLVDQVLAGLSGRERVALHQQALRLPIASPVQRFHLLAGAGEILPALRVAREAADAGDARLAAAAAALAEAVDAVESAAWHERAARHLFAIGRYETAVPHLDRSIDLDPDVARMQQRLFLLVTAYGRIGDAEASGRALARLYESNPEEPLLARALANDSTRLRGLGRGVEAESAGLRALEIARNIGDDEAMGLAAQTLAYSMLAQARIEEAGPLAEDASQAFTRAGSIAGALRADIARADVLRASSVEGALRILDDALARARAAELRLVVGEILIGRSLVLVELGRLGECRDANAEALRLALEDQRPRDAAIATCNLAIIDACLGHLRSARREARAAIRLARSYYPALESSGWRALARSHRARGRLNRAERAASRALDLAVQRGAMTEIGWCRLEAGEVFMAQRRVGAALAVWEGALAEARPDMNSLRCTLAANAGLAALHQGNLERANALRAVALECAGRTLAPSARAMADWLSAELRFAAGGDDDRDALREAQACLRGFAAVPAPIERAHAAVALAQRAIERGLPDRVVREWAEWATAEFDRMGDRRSHERALVLLVQCMREREHPLEDRGHELIEAVSEMLISLTNLRDLSHSAMELVVRQLDAERGVFLVVDPENNDLVPMAEHGMVDAETRRDAIGYSRRVVRQVAKSGGSMLISDASRDPRAHSKSVVALRIRSILCVPLHAGGRVVGAVYLDDSRRPRAFSEHDQRLLERTAKLLAAAIDRSQSQHDVERTNEVLVGENLELRREAAGRFQQQMLVGSSMAMHRILPLVERASQTNATVLVSGENGTGKELIARIVHFGGRRRLRPFVPINCGAIPETLLESELFGILPNVATGVRGRDGRFRQADGGTLFLDEVGDMPLRQQVALLSAIANREIIPVGGGKAIPVDVRIIAATNRDLGHMVEEGTFREDLFYRLNVLPITVPPLRERKSDIPQLAHHFAARFAAAQDRETPDLSREFLALIMRSDWAGNVRELQNYMERVMAMTTGDRLEADIPPRDLEMRVPQGRDRTDGTLADQIAAVERRLIEEALRRCNGNQTLAARELGMFEQGLRYRMRKYGLPTRQNRRKFVNLRRNA